MTSLRSNMWHVIWIAEWFGQVSCITHPSHLRYVDFVIFHLDFQDKLWVASWWLEEGWRRWLILEWTKKGESCPTGKRACDRKQSWLLQYIFNVFWIYFQIIFSDRMILLLCFWQQTISLYLMQDPFRTRVPHWYPALTSFVYSHRSSYNIIWTHLRSWKRSISKQIWAFYSWDGRRREEGKCF